VAYPGRVARALRARVRRTECDGYLGVRRTEFDGYLGGRHRRWDSDGYLGVRRTEFDGYLGGEAPPLGQRRLPWGPSHGVQRLPTEGEGKLLPSAGPVTVRD
jgi:hypothetical protein